MYFAVIQSVEVLVSKHLPVEGSSVKLTCQPGDSIYNAVTWYHNGIAIPIHTQTKKYTVNNHHHTLAIHHLDPSQDDGYYQCKLTQASQLLESNKLLLKVHCKY